MYQLRFSRGLHNFSLGLALVELVKNTRWTWTINSHFLNLAKFTKRFRQVKQVHVLNYNYEDLCWPLIDTYKLAVTRWYLYLVRFEFCRRKKKCHFLAVILHPGWNHPYKNHPTPPPPVSPLGSLCSLQPLLKKVIKLVSLVW